MFNVYVCGEFKDELLIGIDFLMLNVVWKLFKEFGV